ncbi:phosphotransferase enzyme family protein [Aspergillus clavatus NRRL 1]|uniref:Phosphotransferase enzyme family protein n=1 Tax=Aspergillus clavatus (strain ATCC 1007 / CBS 513.65 / DSM 816 / NCTC 3887 / NRRL 1 / QM 1276 / 107) TaxID=344612 RepID=A1CPM0_ASPCL|nr:phosphotransferase enzyme family protein [Aspergillus clavatus NRRL 1]EAW07591.1 phosphotransferase enzyme family protein [Aspergillus clavatus NRRL 1]
MASLGYRARISIAGHALIKPSLLPFHVRHMHHHTPRSSAPCESFFKNTSRRWIFNEEKRLQERYVEFNVPELLRVTATAMHQNRRPDIVKFAEGGFNRAFLVRTDEGKEVIARIPTLIAGPPHYTTASEVATMNFLRNVLDLPVPRVLAYSCDSANTVGAEYIIMEKISGESLASRWFSLSAKEVTHIMAQLAQFEKKIFSFPFPGYGSLYHSRDIQGESQMPLGTDDYCIGPVAKRQFWHDERGQMDLDRGPWKSPIDCLMSAARREAAYLRTHAQPRPRRRFLLPTEHSIPPSEHLSLLAKFEQLASFLIPKDPSLSTPTLRHPDLSLANILLVPGSTKIASIIDWQDAAIFPLFMQAGYPAFCEHDMAHPQSLETPTLPEDFDSMTAEEQLQAQAQLRQEEANLYYTAATGIHHDAHLRALRIPHLGMRQHLIQQTGYPWDADLINLRAALVGITSPAVWEGISSEPCPVSFSDEERQKAMEESTEWNESEALLSRIRDHLGIDLEGGTEPENFEWAFNRNVEFRLEMLRQAGEQERETCWRNWPFKEDEDCSPAPDIPE